MAVGVESTYNCVGWRWWGGEDEPPPPKGEVLFFVLDEELLLSPAAFLPYLREAADRLSLRRPEQHEEIERVVGQIGRLLAIR
jgi:hypothetical protein